MGPRLHTQMQGPRQLEPLPSSTHGIPVACSVNIQGEGGGNEETSVRGCYDSDLEVIIIFYPLHWLELSLTDILDFMGGRQM